MSNAETESDRERDLLVILADVVNQGCHVDAGVVDSMALSAYADAMRVLADYGVLIIDHEAGRRVIGHWAEQ